MCNAHEYYLPSQMLHKNTRMCIFNTTFYNNYRYRPIYIRKKLKLHRKSLYLPHTFDSASVTHNNFKLFYCKLPTSATYNNVSYVPLPINHN